MKIGVKNILLLLSLLLFCVSAAGQCRLFGKVTDEKGVPLAGVEVFLAEDQGKGVVSDHSGFYELAVENMKRFNVVFSFVDFETQEHLVSLEDSKSEFELNVKMKEAVTQLGGFEVKKIRRQTESSEYIDVSAYKAVPDANKSIESIVSTQAGVSSNNELSSQYSVRGGNYDENSVYVNHIEVYRPLLIRAGQQEGLSFVNPDMVGSIQFSSVGFSSEFGDKMSSVLDIQYKKPSEFEGAAEVSLLGASGYVGTASGSFTQLHGVRYKTLKHLLGSLDTNGEYSPSFFDYQTYLTLGLSEKWDLSFLGNISRNSYEFVPQTRKTSFGTMTNTKEFTVYFDGKEKDLFQTFFGNLSLNFKPADSLELGLLVSAFNSQERETFDIAGEYWLSETAGNEVNADAGSGIGKYHEHARNNLHSTVFNISQIGKVCLKRNLIKWGLTYQREVIDDKADEWEMRDSAGYSVPMLPDRLLLYYNLAAKQNLETDRFIAYIQDTYTNWTERGKVSVTAGLRANYWSFNDELLISPRVSFAYLPKRNKNLGFRVAAGMYHQAPFYKEIKDTVVSENGNTDVVLNKNIKAQRSFQLMVGGDYYYKMWDRPFKFTTEIYGKYIDRINPYNVDNVRIVYAGENKGDGYVVGLDMKLFGEFVPGTDSWVSLSLMRTKENIYGDGVGYIPRPTDQLYNFSLFFQDYLPGMSNLKANIKLNWADGLPFGPPRSERKDAVFRSPDYRRVDLGISYSLEKGKDKIMQKSVLKYLKSLTVGLDVLNLFDISNVNSYYWVTDVTNVQYAVPNYLTSRQVNVKLMLEF